MGQHVGFLRAVNVGKRTVKMTRLTAEVEALGFDDVWTHLSSGNVVFSGPGRRADLEARLEASFSPAFGFAVETFVRTTKELQTLVAATPFEVGAGHTHMVTFCRAVTVAQGRALEALSNDIDTLVVAGRDVHWRIVGTVMTSSLKPKDWAGTGVGPTTSRNMTSLRKLVAKLGA